jgi:hypothetical protein
MVLGLRKINFFEVTLLFVGVGVGVVGFMVINNLYKADHVLTWNMFQTVFLWLLLIITLILAATMEDVKEELAIVIREQVQETKILGEETKLMKAEITLLKHIEEEQLQELQLLRKEFVRKGKNK